MDHTDASPPNRDSSAGPTPRRAPPSRNLKVTAFYYLDYPNYSPADPSYAATMMYVEVGDQNSTENNFLYTYAIQVYTLRYVVEAFRSGEAALFGRSVLIVPDFKHATMAQFLRANVDHLHEWADVR